MRQHVRRQEGLVGAVQVSRAAGSGVAAHAGDPQSRETGRKASPVLLPVRGTALGPNWGALGGQGECSLPPKACFLPVGLEATHRVPGEGPPPQDPSSGGIRRCSPASLPERSVPGGWAPGRCPSAPPGREGAVPGPGAAPRGGGSVGPRKKQPPSAEEAPLLSVAFWVVSGRPSGWLLSPIASVVTGELGSRGVRRAGVSSLPAGRPVRVGGGGLCRTQRPSWLHPPQKRSPEHRHLVPTARRTRLVPEERRACSSNPAPCC